LGSNLTLLRAQLYHTPANPFEQADALRAIADGGLLFEEGRILALGSYPELERAYPHASVLDRRDAVVLPGLVDTHVHYPQIPVIGAMGLRLLEWLKQRTLPEEEKFRDVSYARTQARIFLRQLARNGTTTALVFGAHFADAMDAFFAEAAGSGLRITSGLVVSDRHLTEALHTTPERAYRENRALLESWHGVGRVRYAVIPRFSLSCSEALLEVCAQLLQETPDLLFTSHLNETVNEIRTVRELFPWAGDYLETYEHFGLLGSRSVYAHNVYVTDSELSRLARAQASVSHCPSSNMFIGSGLFSLTRHLEHQVHVALGSDVGGGTGFNLFKEGLMAYQGQMLQHQAGYPLHVTHLLYLATTGGARALALEGEVGDFSPGKQADFLVLRPPEDSTLAATLKHSPSAEASLASIFTLAREESIAEVYVAGTPVWTSEAL
jgi:guanine deaminase